MQTYAYTVLEVGGIQNYILATGKLKEMIGGSEMIESLGERACAICENNLQLRETHMPHTDNNFWYMPLQTAAGTVRILFPNKDTAREFLTFFSEQMLEKCPGLPLYGTTVHCSWDVQALKNAYKEAKDIISQKRGQASMAPKSLWPFSKVAALDGLPAVTKDKTGGKSECISALSQARRHYTLIENAEKRLQERVHSKLSALLGAEVSITWPKDMKEMFLHKSDDLERIALIHMDGNDLGQQFRQRLDKAHATPADFIESLKDLSKLVENANTYAFAGAVCACVEQDIKRKANIQDGYTVPVRPLVLGGDDLTVIVRADLAFTFIDTYAGAFEEYTEEASTRLSVGAGMVIMQSAYPFVRAFKLAEQLTESAKKLTKNAENRPSSVDYLILTNDVPHNLDSLRESIATAEDGVSLTAKPFICGSTAKSPVHLRQVLDDAKLVLECLPASGTRDAISQCRKGRKAAQRAWKHMQENIVRQLGGRRGQERLSHASFTRIFKDSFFVQHEDKECTFLGDYIELRHLNLFDAKEGR